MKIRLYCAVSLLTVIMATVWLPVRAQAQFSFTLSSAPVSGAPGAMDVTFSGTLTNPGTFALTSDQDPSFNLLAGPAGADLTTFPVYLDNFFAPDPLTPGTTANPIPIFSVNIDPSAPLGQYTGNISFGYGGHTTGQDVTVNVVPEASSLPLLAVGGAYIGMVLWCRRPCRSSL